ncbi:MAG: PAS domain S-box protein [Bacteroidales bacterium]|nr:PAS domain S-box protein [Bacteroidales bacterium]
MLIKTKGGTLKTGLFSAEIINVAGEPCLLSVMTDITDKKRVERERDHHKEYTGFLYRFIPDALITYDLTGRITLANKKSTELTGYSETELVGMPVRQLYQDIDFNDIITKKSKGPLYRTECCMRRKDSSTVIVSKNLAQLLSIEQQHIGYIEVIKDISEIKEWQQKVFLTQRRLEDSNRTKDKFFSIISHDIKKPVEQRGWVCAPATRTNRQTGQGNHKRLCPNSLQNLFAKRGTVGKPA